MKIAGRAAAARVSLVVALIFAVGCAATFAGLSAARKRSAPEVTTYAECAVVREETIGSWVRRFTANGYQYHIYTPNGKYLSDNNSRPLVVTLHGSMGKYSAREVLGEPLITSATQEGLGGAFVAVLMSKEDYFTDPVSFVKLIETIAASEPRIDPSRIALFGHSQGAAFAFELALEKPSLFRAAVSSSGYYRANVPRAFRLAPVRWYVSASRDDTGIYEPSRVTGLLLSVIARDSLFREFDGRGHFVARLEDTVDKSGKTLLEWLVESLR